MNRLPMMLCAIAVAASIVSGTLVFRLGKAKEVVESNLQAAGERIVKLTQDLAATREQNTGLEGQLHASETKSERLHASLKSAEARFDLSERELKHARELLDSQELTIRTLSNELAAVRQDLDESRASNATPAAVEAFQRTVADLERQLAAAGSGALISNGAAGSTAVFTSRPERFAVVTVGPENAFVILNYGSNRGAQIGQKLVVTQGTNEIATVLVSDVRPNVSIAQVVPDSIRGVLQKGDLALLVP